MKIFTENDNDLKGAVKQMLDNDLRSEIKSELARYYKLKPEKQRFNLKLLTRMLPAVAASLIAIAIVIFLVRDGISDFDTSLQEQLAEMPVSHPGLLKGDNAESEDIRYDAITAYGNKDWELAASAFGKIEKPTMQDAYYQGLSNFYDKNYNAAISVFTGQDWLNSSFAEEVQWFKALSYCATSKRQECKLELQEIGSNEWKYREAQSLLKQLE